MLKIKRIIKNKIRKIRCANNTKHFPVRQYKTNILQNLDNTIYVTMKGKYDILSIVIMKGKP